MVFFLIHNIGFDLFDVRLSYRKWNLAPLGLFARVDLTTQG